MIANKDSKIFWDLFLDNLEQKLIEGYLLILKLSYFTLGKFKINFWV